MRLIVPVQLIRLYIAPPSRPWNDAPTEIAAAAAAAKDTQYTLQNEPVVARP